MLDTNKIEGMNGSHVVTGKKKFREKRSEEISSNPFCSIIIILKKIKNKKNFIKKKKKSRKAHKAKKPISLRMVFNKLI